GRVVGAPDTLDPTPARVEFEVHAPLGWSGQSFYGRLPGADGGGCSSCNATGASPGSGAGWLALLLGATLLLVRRRLRPQAARALRGAGAARWLALLLLPLSGQL